MNNTGFFNYMSVNSSNSLFRNGKVLTRRDINGSDAGSIGIELEKHKMDVINARNLLSSGKISLNNQGFDVLQSKLPEQDFDFFNNNEVLNVDTKTSPYNGYNIYIRVMPTIKIGFYLSDLF